MTKGINFRGPLGSCGSNEANITANSMYASNTIGSVISVNIGSATNIPLPNNQHLDGFTVNTANTIFTVPKTGLYYITYQINVVAAVGLGGGSRLLLNGTTPVPGSILRPTISASTFNSDLFFHLNAGDTISLQLFSTILLTATLLSASGSTGAALTIIRVD